MPVHDWTKVDAWILHDFHTAWIIEIRNALNNGVLPEGYYALAEQHAGRFIPDILALHVSPATQGPPSIHRMVVWRWPTLLRVFAAS